MSVFTIYCHGTGGHRDKPDKEIVAYLGRRANGQEYRDYLILDGVGGTPKNPDKMNPMAGQFNWADKNKAPKGDTPAELGGGYSMSGPGKVGRASASGHGVEDNVRHAIVAIADLPQLPDTVNLIGWSRGAVTALMIANALYDPSTTEGLFRSIDVNIFAIDPVSGKETGHGPDAETRRLIPPTVKNYLCLLATGENRETFKPQDLSRVQIVDKRQSNVVFLPFPGKHNTVAQNNNPKAVEVSTICWSMGYQFLKNFGTTVSTPPRLLSVIEYLDQYSGVVAKAETYGKIRQKGFKQWAIGMGFGKRDVAKELDRYVVNSDYFVNEHHRACFEFECPKLFSWLFTMNEFRPGLKHTKVGASHPAGREVLQTARVSPNFAKTLPMLGIEIDGSIVTLPGPGSSFDAKGAMNLQVKGDLMRMGVLI